MKFEKYMKFEKLKTLFEQNKLSKVGSELFQDMMNDGLEEKDFVDIWLQELSIKKNELERDIESMLRVERYK